MVCCCGFVLLQCRFWWCSDIDHRTWMAHWMTMCCWVICRIVFPHFVYTRCCWNEKLLDSPNRTLFVWDSFIRKKRKRGGEGFGEKRREEEVDGQRRGKDGGGERFWERWFWWIKKEEAEYRWGRWESDKGKVIQRGDLHGTMGNLKEGKEKWQR